MDGDVTVVTKVTRQQLASLLGLSENTITNYVKLAMPGVSGKGKSQRFILSEAIKFVKAYEVQKALKSKQAPENEDMEAVELRLKRAKADREEYETAKRMDWMVTVEDSQKEIQGHIERLRVKLLALPAVWGPQVLGLKEIPEAVDVLSDLVYNLMEGLAQPEDEDEDEQPEEGDTEEEAVSDMDSEEDASE